MGRFNTSSHGLRISTLKAHACSTLPIPIFYIQSEHIFRLLFELQVARMTYAQSIWLVTNIYLFVQKKKTNIYLSMYMSIYLYTHSLHQWVLNKFAIFWKLKFKHNAFDFQLQFHKVSLSFSQHSRQNDNHLNFVGMDGTIGYINFSITGASFHLFTFHLFKESDGRTRRPI